MAQYQSRDYFLMAFHFVALAFALILTLVTMFTIVASDENKTAFHITNTFLSKYDSDSPLNTYIPLNEPPTLNVVNDTFYTCLMNAEVAVNDVYKCKKDTLDGYRTCVNGLVTPAFRVKRMMESITKILGDFDGEPIEVTQLPTWLTSADTATTLSTWLTSDQTRHALKQELAAQTTGLATHILDAITTVERMTGIPTCIASVSTSLLTEYSASYDISTAFDSMWKCTSDVILVEPIHKRSYDKCIPLSAWPAKDIMQTAYTDTLLGSYNKYFFLWIGLWLLTSFAVYTSPGWPSASTENGKPKHYLARAGKAFVTFGFVWNLAAILIVVVRTFNSADSFKDTPMSVQTALVTLFFTIAASIYFGREVYELFFLADRPPDFKFKGTSTRVSSAFHQKRLSAGRMYHGIAAFMAPGSASYQEVPDEEYAPLVAPVWNDAWFFVDGLFFLTVVGMSYDTVTVDIVVSVFCILAAALCNSALVRLLYEGYINPNNVGRPPMSPQTVQALQESAFIIRVMAVVSMIAGLIFSLIVMILVAMRFRSNVVSFYVACTSLAPQVFWLIVVFLMEYRAVSSASGFFTTTSSFFAVSVIVRLAFLCWVLSYLNYDYDMTEGNSDSLQKLLAYINVNTIASPSYL